MQHMQEAAVERENALQAAHQQQIQHQNMVNQDRAYLNTRSSQRSAGRTSRTSPAPQPPSRGASVVEPSIPAQQQLKPVRVPE